MIRAIKVDIVDASGQSVPLEQLYNHHLFLGTIRPSINSNLMPQDHIMIPLES